MNVQSSKYLYSKLQKYNIQMSKDFFQRNVDVMNDLRSQQFKIREYLQRGKYKMKQKFFNKGKKHYDFDLNSQEYFHQELYDIIFENSQIQQQFHNYVVKFLQEPCQFKNESKYYVKGISGRKNQSEVRQLLYRFFNNRIQDLQYEKYLIMQRLNNINAEQQISLVKSRLVLIDKEIQMAISRSDRLSCEDYFEETYTLGGKPVPVNENGQSIYKYLDEQECWYSNIHRDDIIIYTRSRIYRREILHKIFYPIYYQHKHLVKTEGLNMMIEVEEEIAKNSFKVKQNALKKSKKIISIFEQELQLISPGNLAQKENITAFIYYNFGVEEGQLPLNMPLYPAMYSELIDNYNVILPYFFKSLQLKQHKQLITLLPKFNNFCAIIFKYQNKQILEGKQEIKLGLEDDIDIKKELFTMLQEIWVNKYVKVDFQRFDIRYRLHSVDWPLDTITEQHHRQKKHLQEYSKQMKENTQIKTLLNILKGNNYNSFRKHMKRHSEIIVNRLKDKFTHMQKINRYNVLNNEEHTLQQLGEFFRIKFNQKETHTESILKQNAALFFNVILKKHLVINPVQIEIQQTLRIIKLRENRLKMMNILNGMRCYHRNLAFDLKVISNYKFQFQLDDEMLVNSNKQVLQSFEKAVKDTQTFFSKQSHESNPIQMGEQQFVQYQRYNREKLYKQDKVSYSYFGEQIAQVLVSNGKRLKTKIMYEIVLDDIEEIQQRLLRNSTNFINRYERYIKVKSLEQIIDRIQLLSRIYQLQLEYQFQKLKLIESYYLIYQNTKEPLQAFKISKIIVNLIYKKPEIDLQQTSFQHAYKLNIESIIQENKLVSQLNLQLQKAESQKCKLFHDKFARSLHIPLTLLAYLYGDLQKKAPKNMTKLQRMNSMASRISKESRKQQKGNKFEFQIKQQYPEADDDSQQEFDLQNYDEYLLRKNMDAIFDEMIGDQHGNHKEAIPVNTVALENLIVNPRYEGGPHVKINVFPQIEATSQRKVNLLNFMQVSWIIGNIRYLVDELQQQFQKEFGFCSTLYQVAFSHILLKKMYYCSLNPKSLPPKWLNFQTDDPYMEIVTKGMRYYEQIMSPCLQPPSNVQLAIPSTFQRHHQKIANYGILQYFDFHSIQSLILLKKPINSFRYRQHNLGIGFIELLQLQDHAWLMQLERRELSKAYQNLGKHCDLILERSVSEYTNTGQSQVFLAVQENKLYNTDVTKYLIFPDMIEEVRDYFSCQIADIQVFKKHIELSKRQLQDLLIMKYQIDKKFVNKRLDKTRMLAPNDPKDIKKIKNRILSLISVVSNEVLKSNTFLKYKNSIKTALQIKLKEVADNDYEKVIDHKQKMTVHCVDILVSKYKRILQLKLLQCYSKDLLATVNKKNVAIETIRYIQKLKNYTISVPFLSNIFIVPTQNKMIDNKILYDQAKNKKMIPLEEEPFKDGEIKNIYYIFSAQQYFQAWFKDNNDPIVNNLVQFDTNSPIIGLNPPAGKQNIFKWAFKIPQSHIEVIERDALNYLVKMFHPFSGKITQPSYRQNGFLMQEPSRNKYFNLMKHYKSLVEYIEANILVISLQIEEQVLYSLQNIIKKKINFEERYFITDQNSIRQTINTLQNQDLSVIYNFAIDFAKLNKHVAQKIIERNYIDKKEHWVVHDEIIDFMMSKIQGYGLIRKSYLPLYDDLKLLKDIKGSPVNYLVNKTNNIYKLIYISTIQTYLNEINEQNSDFYVYQHKIQQWLCHSYRLQDYGCSGQQNCRINITNLISEDEDEKQRFMNGIYVNDTNMLIHKLKHIGPVVGHDINHFVKKMLFKTESQQQKTYSLVHNINFMEEAISVFKIMGERNRFKVFARIRHHFDLADNYLSTKPLNTPVNDLQIHKSNFLDLLIGKRVFILASIYFSDRVILPANAKSFKQTFMELKEVNQIHSHNLFENLQKFKEENKIQFSKSQMNLIGRNEGGNDHQHNVIIKKVIAYKLLKEEFRFRVLNESLRLLRAERIPKAEPKRIINASLIPRVHLISSYSSPLMIDRKSYISQQYKLSFLQAFINRFRNKVSRVDLLSSGYGFVITVPDLQDCVNYINKLLFTFTQKEFKHRIETFSQYYEILIEAINEKNKTINEQSALIKYLQNKNNNLLQAEYLSKVSKLLHEKTILEDKLLIMENNINGLQDRVRKTVQIQYDKKITKLQKQNEELREIFTKVKHLHMINTKEAAKNEYLDIINYYKQKINELLNKKVDFTISFDSAKKEKSNGEKVKDEDNSSKYKDRAEKGEDDKYYTQDLQRCKLGQDILFDPYYTTKLINKMRLFNLFKLGSKKLKFEEQQFKKQQKLTELHKIQDIVVAQSQRDILIRNQLSKVQQELSKKCLELQKLKQSFDTVENEKTKLKILMQSKEKKIQQKDREVQQLKKSIAEKDKLLAQRQTIEKQKSTDRGQDAPKLNALRKEKKYKKIDKTFLTNAEIESNHQMLSLYQKFQLSNKDSTWRQKCQQIYMQNKRLQNQLQKYQNNTMSIPSTPKREGHSLNLRMRRQSMSQSSQKPEPRFPNISFKYNIMKQ